MSLSLLLRASSLCVLTCATRLYEGATTAAEGAAADNAAVVAEAEEILEPVPDLSTSLLNSGPFINFLLHNHSVIYKILIFFFRRSKRQRNFSLFYFASQES